MREIGKLMIRRKLSVHVLIMWLIIIIIIFYFFSFIIIIISIIIFIIIIIIVSFWQATLNISMKSFLEKIMYLSVWL